MKKNIMLLIAATFIAAVSLPTVFAGPDPLRKSELLFSYENLSDELVYVAIKGNFSYGEYAVINDIGWVSPQASGDVTNDSPWIVEQKIDKNSFVSLAFLTSKNEVVICKKDFYLETPTKITLKKDANGIFECTASDQSTPPPSPSKTSSTFRFKEITQFTFSYYALLFYDPADDKWKDFFSTIANNTHPGKMVLDAKGYGKSWAVKDMQPQHLSPAFDYDSMVMFAVRENHNNQDEEYNKRLPMWICGNVKFT
ncbi:MAG: hypothetical protein ACRC7P_09880, partial [Enterovibrio sp.]